MAQISAEPENRDPRAIFGNFAEPAWDERVTITVGQKDADLVGGMGRVQVAIDTVARWGGGTVRVLPGVYRLRRTPTHAQRTGR